MTLLNNKKNTQKVGISLTFRELIENFNKRNGLPTKIIIPRMQRDYAQGREDKKEIRENFLDNIFDILNSQNPNERIYDFVYGKLDPSSNKFFPVDGQQRLTTFFLLHLYIGKRSREDLDFLYYVNDDEEMEYNFSYETRDSSKLFCQKLLDINADKYADIIQYISDCQWYNGTWENDPTIKSMMTMLEEIHLRCRNLSSPDQFSTLWNNLTQKIKLWVLDLKDLQSTDALYIKMNSRGKHLTDFEHFKAQIEGLISQNKTLKEGEFSKEIDTTWTNVFWAYRDNNFDFEYAKEGVKDNKNYYHDNGTDGKIENFIRNFFILYGVRHRIFSTSNQGSLLSDIELAKKVIPQHPEVINQLTFLMNEIASKSKHSHGDYHKLEAYFNKFVTTESEQQRYANNGDKSNDYLVNIYMDRVGCKSTDIFEMFFGDPTLQQKLLGYAFFIWKLYNKRHQDNQAKLISVEDFKNRLRILRNLIANTYLHDDTYHTPFRSTMIGVECLIIKGVNRLLAYGKDEFPKPQKEQESLKESFITTNPSLMPLIPELENHTMLRGNLSQLLPVSPTYSLDSLLKKFRDIFSLNVDLDQVEATLLNYGDYARKEDYRSMYGGDKEENWRFYIMQSANNNTAPILQAALTDANFVSANLVNIKNGFLNKCSTNHIYPWIYYLCKYKDIRDIPYGIYRKDNKAERYTYWMCNASGKLQGNEKFWNPYLYTLSVLFRHTSMGKWGSRLRINGIELDVFENTYSIYRNGNEIYRILIPQNNNGLDTVDRITFIDPLMQFLSNNASLKEDDFMDSIENYLTESHYKIDKIRQ